MRRRIYAHRNLVGVFAGNPLVHFKEVAVLFLDSVQAVALYGVGEIKVHAPAGTVDNGAYPASVVARLLRRARGYVARGEIAEARIFPFEVIVAIIFGYVVGVLGAVLRLLGNPYAAVVAQRLAHEGQLALLVAVLGNACRVDLREAWVCEAGAALVALERRRHAAALRVCGKVEHVAVAARAQQNRVGGIPLDLAGDEVADDDALGVPVHEDEVEHFAARVHLHLFEADLLFKRGIRAEQELLARLPARVESAADLRAAKRAVGEQPAVLAGEGDPLRHALVDNVAAHFRKAVDVRLARAEVAAFYGVVKEAVNAVAVVLVIFGGVDAALGGDGVRAAGAVLVAKALDVVPLLRQARRRRRARQPAADNYHAVLAAVRGVDELGVRLKVGPLLGYRPFRNFRIQIHDFPFLLYFLASGFAAAHFAALPERKP